MTEEPAATPPQPAADSAGFGPARTAREESQPAPARPWTDDPALSRRAALLALLREADGAPVSGQDAAERLGVSRAAVSNHVAALRREGYEVTSAPRVGYRLVTSPDLPLPLEVGPLLGAARGQVGLHGGRATGSTNDDAKGLAQAGLPEVQAILADKQTKGRGRLGRVWQSPEGGLYVSYVLRPPAMPEQAVSLSLVTGLAVADSLERLGVPGVRLKWPNDVLLFDAGGHELGKLAGILTEMAAQMERVEYVIPGIGVNVNRPGDGVAPAINDGGRRRAVYLSDVMEHTPTLARLAAVQIDSLYVRYEAWKAAGCSFEPFVREYSDRLALVGQNVRVSNMDGAVLAAGVVLGVDALGRLLVRREDGTAEAVTAGEVTLR